MSDLFPRTLIDPLLTKSEEQPDQVCFYGQSPEGWQPHTHREFLGDVLSTAQLLRDHDVGKGERVGILGSPCYEWVVCDKAILYIGATSVGLDPKSATSDLVYVVSQAALVGLFIENIDLLARVPEDVRKGLRFIVLLTPTEAASTPDGLIALPQCLGEPPTAPFEPSAEPDDLAVIIFTSGTTGKPKGIPLKHRQLASALPVMHRIFREDLGGEHRTIAWVPLYNGTGRLLDSVNYYLDATQYFLPDPMTLFDQIKVINPTYLVLVPRILEKVYQQVQAKLAEQPAAKRWGVQALVGSRATFRNQLWERLTDRLLVAQIREAIWGDSLRFLISGSAAIDAKILRFFGALGVPTYEVYGLSEIAFPISMNRPGRFRYGSVGQPVEDLEVKTAADQEICVKTSAALAGYLGSDEDDIHDEQGYLKTGDLGELRDGYLYITGRKKEIFKTSTGQRISPVAIEEAYKDTPGIDTIIVVGDGRKYLTALVGLEADFSQSLEKQGVGATAYLRAEFEKRQGRLASNRQVKDFRLFPAPLSVEEGELTPTLKLRRLTIEKRYASLVDEMYPD